LAALSCSDDQLAGASGRNLEVVSRVIFTSLPPNCHKIGQHPHYLTNESDLETNQQLLFWFKTAERVAAGSPSIYWGAW